MAPQTFHKSCFHSLWVWFRGVFLLLVGVVCSILFCFLLCFDSDQGHRGISWYTVVNRSDLRSLNVSWFLWPVGFICEQITDSCRICTGSHRKLGCKSLCSCQLAKTIQNFQSYLLKNCLLWQQCPIASGGNGRKGAEKMRLKSFLYTCISNRTIFLKRKLQVSLVLQLLHSSN